MLQLIKKAMTGKEDDGDDGGDGGVGVAVAAWWLPPRSPTKVKDDLEVLGSRASLWWRWRWSSSPPGAAATVEDLEPALRGGYGWMMRARSSPPYIGGLHYIQWLYMSPS